MFLTKFFNFVKAHKLFSAAVAASLIGHSLDIISTELVMAFVKGSYEANPWVRDPVTLKFALGPALQIKGVAFAENALMSLVGWVAENEMLAAVPFLIDAWYAWGVSVHNLLVLWKG